MRLHSFKRREPACEAIIRMNPCNRPFGDFPVGRGFYEVSQGMQINPTNHSVIENIEVGMALGKLIAMLHEALAKA
ncbi:hypothetical protein CMV24_15650 [Pseudomonas plecoglossicida]|uniref:Uncharacterized protein n=3 Tax=Pseudomonas TaxID=286 RepID=A0A2A3M3I5_PSEDL|nr:hypothetical protein O164_19380 [Pseudomonas taiwanensis SJ9]PBJ94638.1 hypothetical protein CMV24_15650 [Pseudomonas plecoglossicida]